MLTRQQQALVEDEVAQRIVEPVNEVVLTAAQIHRGNVAQRQACGGGQ